MAVEDLRWWTGSEWVSVKDFRPDALDDYLPLAGGTMTGTAIVDWGNTLSDGTAPGDFSRLRLYDAGGAGIAGMGISTSSFNIGSQGPIDVRIWANGSEFTRHYGLQEFTRHYVDLFFEEQLLGSVQNTPTAPPYSFEGDATTGVYAPAMGSVAITTSGTERLRVRPSGTLALAQSNTVLTTGSDAHGISQRFDPPNNGMLQYDVAYAQNGTNTAYGIWSQINSNAPDGTAHTGVFTTFQSGQTSAEANTTVSEHRGFSASDQVVPETASGFFTSMAPRTGKTRYGIFCDGTAPNRFDGQLIVPAGSPAVPSIALNGDDTGISFATDTIVLSTGATERLRVSRSGLTIPDNYQDETGGVYGVYSAINKSATNAGGTFQFLAGGDAPSQFHGQVFVTSFGAATPSIANRSDPSTGVDIQPGFVAVSTAGTERMRVRDDGCVGIGFLGRSYDLLAVGGPSADNASPRGVSVEHVIQGVSAGASSSFMSAPSTIVSAWGVYHFNVNDTTGTGALSNQFGFNVNDLQKADTNHGVRVRVNDGAGKTNYCIFADGTAPNYFNGQIQASPGTAAAPSICWYGETSTGLFRPGTDEIAISTAGTERLRVDNGGQITAAAGYTPTADQDLATRKFVEDQVALGGGASVTTADVNLSNPTRSLGRFSPPSGLATQEDANQAIGDAIAERKIVLPISQADYDLLPVKDPDTLYLIVT